MLAEESTPKVTEDQIKVMKFLESEKEITFEKLPKLGTVSVNNIIVNHYFLEKMPDSDLDSSSHEKAKK